MNKENDIVHITRGTYESIIELLVNKSGFRTSGETIEKITENIHIPDLNQYQMKLNLILMLSGFYPKDFGALVRQADKYHYCVFHSYAAITETVRAKTWRINPDGEDEELFMEYFSLSQWLEIEEYTPESKINPIPVPKKCENNEIAGPPQLCTKDLDHVQQKKGK